MYGGTTNDGGPSPETGGDGHAVCYEPVWCILLGFAGFYLNLSLSYCIIMLSYDRIISCYCLIFQLLVHSMHWSLSVQV